MRHDIILFVVFDKFEVVFKWLGYQSYNIIWDPVITIDWWDELGPQSREEASQAFSKARRHFMFLRKSHVSVSHLAAAAAGTSIVPKMTRTLSEVAFPISSPSVPFSKFVETSVRTGTTTVRV